MTGGGESSSEKDKTINSKDLPGYRGCFRGRDCVTFSAVPLVHRPTPLWVCFAFATIAGKVWAVWVAGEDESTATERSRESGSRSRGLGERSQKKLTNSLLSL
ncbi:Uncharacterized protein Rs2_35703 [Raphanus sativus]|nr:Uncharacterized protein Rs2_35703 [Raphanus sativus]